MRLAHGEVVKLANPAAGAGLKRVIPSDYYEKLMSVQLKLATSAVVANRVPSLVFADGDGVQFGTYPASVAIVAGSTATITFAMDVESVTANTNALVSSEIPGLILPPGFQWQVTVAGIDVGDQISAVAAYIWRAPSGPYQEAYGVTPYDPEKIVYLA